MTKPKWATSPSKWEAAQREVRKKYGINSGQRFKELSEAQYLISGGGINRNAMHKSDDFVFEASDVLEKQEIPSVPDVFLSDSGDVVVKSGTVVRRRVAVEVDDLAGALEKAGIPVETFPELSKTIRDSRGDAPPSGGGPGKVWVKEVPGKRKGYWRSQKPGEGKKPGPGKPEGKPEENPEEKKPGDDNSSARVQAVAKLVTKIADKVMDKVSAFYEGNLPETIGGQSVSGGVERGKQLAGQVGFSKKKDDEKKPEEGKPEDGKKPPKDGNEPPKDDKPPKGGKKKGKQDSAEARAEDTLKKEKGKSPAKKKKAKKKAPEKSKPSARPSAATKRERPENPMSSKGRGADAMKEQRAEKKAESVRGKSKSRKAVTKKTSKRVSKKRKKK